MICSRCLMRTIKQTSQFKRDLKREATGLHRKHLKEHFVSLTALLANDVPLTEKYKDHALTGNLKGYRDCHIKPDLVFIYRKPDDETLELVRIGSHSELGL